MVSLKYLRNALLIGVLVSLLLIAGCTSSSSPSSSSSSSSPNLAGTYTATGDDDHSVLQLNADGTGTGSSDTGSTVQDTWTADGSTLKVCVQGMDTCTSGTINSDGSLTFGPLTFRKN
jgi:ABC-type Fe3+-hydroxamate transport system substrate-binding protein